MKKNYEKQFPRILVISNNPFSTVNNNGKTLASLFDSYPSRKLAQLYFSQEDPSHPLYNNFYRISDNDILRKFFHKTKSCGNEVFYKASFLENKDNLKSKKNIKIPKNSFFRILRELIWSKSLWNSKEFNLWLERFSPDIVFLCAGDSGFAYTITNYIKNKFGSKLVIYITDDYILPRKTISVFWWIRRNFIFSKMKNAINQSDLLLTISEKMQRSYKYLFNKESIIALNTPPSLISDYSNDKNARDKQVLVYAGGLHYKRYVTLSLLAKAIYDYNKTQLPENKVFLQIYSNTIPKERIRKKLCFENASGFLGSLNHEELKKVLNKADIMVHVEAFDKKSIEATRLSVSTKIPEYLSLGKPILAIGPCQIASMEYLEDCSFCINNKEDIYRKVSKFLSDEKLRKVISEKALEKYHKNHEKEKVNGFFIDSIRKIYRR